MKEIGMKILFCMILVLGMTISAHGAVKSEFVQYKHGEVDLEGYLAYNPAVKGKRPGVLVIHDWMGEGEFNRDVCRKLAEKGYVAFAADIYGKGVRPRDIQEAAAQAGIYRKDRSLMRSRAKAAFDVLKNNEMVQRGLIAVMGYCFGGGVSLELARSGAPMAGVISFHGNLDTPHPEDAKNISGKVLILHGADDPHVTPDQVSAFMEEMRAAGVDWQMVHYGGAVHAFTNPKAGNDNSRGAAYNAEADRRSWRALENFLMEIFQLR
ncbi:dienelactone hydrolase family protein [bacterium]|nr:MAG: dienelactone hydrolase family protein [bacterium]